MLLVTNQCVPWKPPLSFNQSEQKSRFWTTERQCLKYQASFSLSLQKEKRRRNAWLQVKMRLKIARPNETRLCGRCKKGRGWGEGQKHERGEKGRDTFFVEKAVLWISALQVSENNHNHFELPLGVWTNLVYKTSWVSLPAKQAITVGSSSCFNVKLLHDCSNFDLPNLMPVEHISLMPSSCLSTRIHANKLLITAQPIRNLRTLVSTEMNERGFLQQVFLTLSPQSPSFFPSPLSPTPVDTWPRLFKRWIALFTG